METLSIWRLLAIREMPEGGMPVSQTNEILAGRYYFLTAVARLNPVVLRDLNSKVGPHFESSHVLWLRAHVRECRRWAHDAQFNPSESVRRLLHIDQIETDAEIESISRNEFDASTERELLEWSRRFNLNEEWIRDIAIDTLGFGLENRIVVEEARRQMVERGLDFVISSQSPQAPTVFHMPECESAARLSDSIHSPIKISVDVKSMTDLNEFHARIGSLRERLGALRYYYPPPITTTGIQQRIIDQRPSPQLQGGDEALAFNECGEILFNAHMAYWSRCTKSGIPPWKFIALAMFQVLKFSPAQICEALSSEFHCTQTTSNIKMAYADAAEIIGLDRRDGRRGPHRARSKAIAVSN
jgi:hypothetical protein